MDTPGACNAGRIQSVLRLGAVIEAFVRPALGAIQGSKGESHFSRLRAMLAAEDAPLFAQLRAENFELSSRTFVGVLREWHGATTTSMSGVEPDGVLGYIEGPRVVDLAAELDVTRGSVNRWLQWYDALGVEGLVTGTPPGPVSKLSEAHRDELTTLIESGSREAGYTSGV